MADARGDIEGVAGWLEKANLMQSGVARRCKTPSQLADELHNGVVLAQIARKLDPSNVSPDKVMGRPSIDYHRRMNVNTFMDAYKRSFRSRVRFTVDDVEMRKNTEQVVCAMHKAAKRIEIESPDLKAFAMPKSSVFCEENVVSSQNYELYTTSDTIHVQSYYSVEIDLPEYEHVISVYGDGNVSGVENTDTYEDGHLLSKYDCAVEEFLGKNRAFCKALDLYQEIGRHSTDDDLRRWFLMEDFSSTIGKLRTFHQKLEKELDVEGRDGAFYDVILRNKTHFLQYCHVLVQTENLKAAISRKDTSDMNGQLSIVKAKVGKDLTKLTNFDSLLSLPFQHLLRQSILLEAILKEGKKDQYDLEDEVLDGIKAAIDAMADVNEFVNAHFGDSLYIDDIDETFKRTKGMDGWRGFDYMLIGGYSKFSQKVQLRMLSDPKTFIWCQIFAFEELVLIFEIVDRGDKGEWLNFKQSVKVCGLVGLTHNKVLQVDGGGGDLRAQQSMSFAIKGEPEKLKELEQKFRDLMRPRVSKCCVKLGEYARLKEGPRSMSIIEEKCNRCHQLLRGRINLGLRCPGCKKVYHKKCFEDVEEKEEEEPEKRAIPERKPSAIDQRLEGMIFRVGIKEDVDRMLSSEAPDGSFLFRPTENDPDCLTLCVKKGISLKKYRIIEVKEGTGATYMWNNQTVQGADGAEEKFPTLNNLVQRKRKVFYLKKDFLDGQNLVEERKSHLDVEMSRSNERSKGTGEDLYDVEIYDDVSYKEKSIVLVGTIEDEERMKKTPPCAGTFLVRPSEAGRHTLCIMNKNNVGKWVERKHHIQTTVGEDNEFSYSLVNKRTDKSVIAGGGGETFPSLEAFIRGKWHHFKLQRNFLDDKSFSDMCGGEEDGHGRNRCIDEQEVAKPEVISLTESTASSTQSSPVPPPRPTIVFNRDDDEQEPPKMKPAMALRNKPPGSFFVSTRDQAKDQDAACVIHWIKPDKTVDSVEFIEVKGGFSRKGSTKIYKTINDFVGDKKEHFSNPVSDEPSRTSLSSHDTAGSVEAEAVDLEAQLSKLKFYVGYLEGYPCHVALSNDPPGTYLLRRKSKEDPALRISFVTEENGQRGYKHLRIKEMDDGRIACKQNNKQCIAKSIEGLISQMDGLRNPYSPKK